MRLRGLVPPMVFVLASAFLGCSSSSGDGSPVTEPAVEAGADVIAETGPDVINEDPPLDAPDDPAANAPEADAPATLCPPDQDGDNIPDEVEGMSEGRDTDHDGIPDYLDDDSDGDSIPDLIEGDTIDVGCMTPLDSDGDGKPDYIDDDSDGNGMLDRDEVYPDHAAYSPSHAAPNPADTDNDGRPDYIDKDNDGDNLDDITELGGKPSQDTDGDGLEDIFDNDSDNDTILDGHEGATDFDDDGKPNFRDDDSDGDAIPDLCEAGPGHTLMQLPIDSDHDGKYDFVDLDSDADGLLDSQEDANHDCVLDPGETNPRVADTDGDGADDMIETALGSDPNDAFVTPESLGKFYFRIPYQETPTPNQHTLAIKTTLNKADIAFVLDTTGTMAEELNQLKIGLHQIILTLLNDIPQLAVGVAGLDDFPISPYGDPAQFDQPFYLPVPNIFISTVPADPLAAAAQFAIHGGGDIPESQVPALVRALTNNALEWPGNYWPPASIPAGRYGAMGFRSDAFPIVALVTDAPFHNGRRVSSPGVLHDPYSFNSTSSIATIDDVVAAFQAKGARFIGLASDDGSRFGDPYEDMAYLADQTTSYVSPSAFGGSCATGIGGAWLSQPDGPNGTCRLVFDVYHDGSGLNESIVNAVQGTLKGLLLDMRVVAISDPVAAPLFVDSVDEFIDHVTVSQNGGDDPTDPGVPCVIVPSQSLADRWKGPKGLEAAQDMFNESVLGVVPTTKICFNVFPKPNSTVPPAAEAQVFHAVLQVRAKKAANAEIDLGAPRDVLFVVPPKPQ